VKQLFGFLLPRKYDVYIHPNWTLWIAAFGNIFEVNHRYRPKPKISLNWKEML